MSEFVGRTGALRVYSYPEPRRSGGEASAFARNYATGVKSTSIGAGIQVNWNSIDVGTDPDEDIPITPLLSGVVLVSGVLTVSNPTGAGVLVAINVQLDDASIPIPTASTLIPANSTVAIPFLAETEAISPLNEQHLIQIFVSGSGCTLSSAGCVCNVQEVPAATG